METQQGEVVENTKINSHRFFQLHGLVLTGFSIFGALFSQWFLIGGATLYIVIKILEYFVEAVLFRQNVGVALSLFIFHLFFILYMSRTVSGVDQESLAWFIAGIAQLTLSAPITLIVSKVIHVKSAT